MPAIDCPSRQELEDYTVGRLAPKNLETVAEHVERCADCQATLVTLADVGDALVAQLRRPLDADSYSEEAECRAVAASAKAMAGDTGCAGGAGDDVPVAEAELPRQLGEYQLLEKLGEGGMGTVYKARQMRLDRIVALKLLPQSSMRDPRLRARFDKEMRAVGRVDHANIVRAHDARDIEGLPVLVMEYVEGMDFGRVASLLGPLPIADSCEAARQAALGLQAAHEQGLVHRDVKPSNLMLASGGQVKILDLGLARLAPCPSDTVEGVPPTGDEAESVTSGFIAMGTADYIAPEQVTDAHRVDIRADVYALGCTLYRLLAGRTPYSGPGYVREAEKMIGHVRDTSRPLGQWRPEVPAELVAVIERMMAKEPAARFATPAEAAEALGPFVAAADLRGLLNSARQRQERRADLSSVPSKSAITDPQGSSALTGTEPGIRAEAEASQPRVLSDSLEVLARENKCRGRGTILTAVGTAAAVVVVLLAVVLKVRTREGTLVVEISEPDVQVEVLSEEGAVQIERPGKQGRMTIGVDPGKHRLRLTKNGEEVFGTDFAIVSGGEETIKATLQPAEPPRGEPTPLRPAPIPIGEWFTLPIKPEELMWGQFGEEGHFRCVYSSGTLQVQNAHVGYPIDARDVSIRVKVKKHVGDGGFGEHIALRLRESGAGNYFAYFNGGRYFGICKFPLGRNEVIDVAHGVSKRDFDDFFDFEFRAVGDELTVLANGEVVAQAFDDSQCSGYVYIEVHRCMVELQKVEVLVPTKGSLIADNRPPYREWPTTNEPPGSPLPNTLTNAEQSAGWRLLFDGRTRKGWKSFQAVHWLGSDNGVVGGTIEMRGPRNMIASEEQFDDFELRFEWRVATRGEGGVFYRANGNKDRPNDLGMTIADNALGKQPAGSIIDVEPAPADAAKPAGQWNQARVVARGNHIDHWLNGRRVAACEIGSPEFETQLTRNKLDPNHGRSPKGPIVLQSWTGIVAYRDIKILPLGKMGDSSKPTSQPTAKVPTLSPRSTNEPPLTDALFDAGPAKQHQNAWTKHLGVPIEMTNSIGMEFALIPPGEFEMGAGEKEINQDLQQCREHNEQWCINSILGQGPRHRVKIAGPFYLGTGRP